MERARNFILIGAGLEGGRILVGSGDVLIRLADLMHRGIVGCWIFLSCHLSMACVQDAGLFGGDAGRRQMSVTLPFFQSLRFRTKRAQNGIANMKSCTDHRIWYGLFTCFSFFFGSAVGAGEFLVISDIHFNPMSGLNQMQFKELRELPATEWPQFFDAMGQSISQPGSDSNFCLMVAALDAAKKRLPNPSFILYPGDFLAHGWQEKYNRLAAKSLQEDPAAFREFTRKSLFVVAKAFRDRFPATRVFATLGNDDAFCQDYWIQPDGSFLSAFFSVWQPLLGEFGASSSNQATIESLGVYACDLPGSSRERLVVLNSVFWSASYCCAYFNPKAMNCCDCVDHGDKPGRQQFDWLERQLATAKQKNKRVWLLMHVPPGIDSYAEEKAKGASRAAELWTEEFTMRYLKLISAYRETLRISFTGHTHMDDFRVDRVGGGPVLLHKIAPAVSPVFGNNPSFQLFEQDDQSGKIVNWQTHFVDLTAGGSNLNVTDWKVGYDAQKAYGINEVSAEPLAALFQGMKAKPDGPAANAYRRHYRVQAKPIAKEDLSIYVCAVLNATFADYHRCVTFHGLQSPKQDHEPARLREAAGGD